MRSLSISSSPLLRLFRPPPFSSHFPSSLFSPPFITSERVSFLSTPLQTHLHFPFSSSPSLPLFHSQTPLQENTQIVTHSKTFGLSGSKDLISDTQNDTEPESSNLGEEKSFGFGTRPDEKVSGSEISIGQKGSIPVQEYTHNCFLAESSSLDEIEPESSNFDEFGGTQNEILAEKLDSDELEENSHDEILAESWSNDKFEEEKDENSKVVDPNIMNAHKELLSKLGGMSVKEKKELASYANGLGKKLKSQQVGKSGVTESVAIALVETLEANELLKIKIHNNCPGELDDVVKHLEDATGSIVVGRIGRTVIIYRPSLTKLKAEEKKKQALKIFQKRRAAFKSSFQSVRGQSSTRTGYSRGGSRS